MSKTTVALVTTAQALGPRHEALARNAEANGLIELVVMDEEQGVAAIVDHCRDAEVLICRNIDMINEVAVGLRNLKLIQTFSAGTDRLDKHILASRGVHVANNGGANAVSVAESAIWLMLTINHKFQSTLPAFAPDSGRAGSQGRSANSPRCMIDRSVLSDWVVLVHVSPSGYRPGNAMWCTTMSWTWPTITWRPPARKRSRWMN